MSSAADSAPAAAPAFFDDDDDDSSDDESFDPEKDGKEEDISDHDDDDDSDDDSDDDDGDDDGDDDDDSDNGAVVAVASRKRKKSSSSSGKRDKKRRRKKKKQQQQGRDGDNDDDDDDDDEDMGGAEMDGGLDSDSDSDDAAAAAAKRKKKQKKKASRVFFDDAAEDDDEAEERKKKKNNNNNNKKSKTEEGDNDDDDDDDDSDEDDDYVKDGFVVDEAEALEEELLRRKREKKKKKKATGDLEDSDDDNDNDDAKDSDADDDSDDDDSKGSNSDSDSDNDDGKKTKRLKKLRDTDVLDDDDLALIQEAQGVGGGAGGGDDDNPDEPEHVRRERAEAMEKERAEARARAETIRAHDADELRKGLFDDEAGEDEDTGASGTGGTGGNGAGFGNSSKRSAAVEIFDEDGMDDFIEDDIGDQAEIRNSERFESARTGTGTSRGGDGGVSEAQLTEASEIFGTDYLDFMEAAQAEEDEEDDEYDAEFGNGYGGGRDRFRERGTGIDYGVDDDDDLDEEGSDDDDDEDLFGEGGDDENDGAAHEQRAEALRLKREKRKLARAERRKEAQQKRLERRRARLRRAFEPVQLVENFCTERDDAIRTKDVPERFFDRADVDPTKAESIDPQQNVLGAAMAEIEAGGDEEEEATWIMSRVPAVASEFFSHLQNIDETFDADEAEKKQMEIIHSIVRVLRLVKHDALEPEFIRRYRGDVVTSPAVRECLHEILDEDAEWDRMTEARNAVEGLLERAVAAAKALGASDDIGVVGGDDPAQLVASLSRQLEDAQSALNESEAEEKRLTAELAALKEGQDEDDDDDDEELFGDDDEDEDEEKKARKAKIPVVEGQLVVTQQVLNARAQAFIAINENLENAKAREAEATGGGEAGAQSMMAKKMCQSKLWNAGDYQAYLSSITEYRHAADVKGYLNLIGEGNDAVRTKVLGANSTDGDKKKRSRRFDRTFYRTCVSEGLRNVCYKFVIPPFRAGIILEDNLTKGGPGFSFDKKLPGEGSDDPARWVPPTVPSNPQEFAGDLVGSGELVLLSEVMGRGGDVLDSLEEHPELQDPLRGCRYVAAMELAYEPRIRRHLRSIYRNNCTLSTRPTSKGKTSIDAFHEYHGLHLIKEKAIKEHFPMDEEEQERRKMGLFAEEQKKVDEQAEKQEHESCTQYLRILKAERSGDIKVNVHLPMSSPNTDGNEWYEQEDEYWNKRENQDLSCLTSELEKVYFPLNGDTDEWNGERRKVIHLALTQFLLPQFEVEIRRDLREASVKKGAEEAADTLGKMAMEGPLRPTYMITENRFLVPTGDLKMVGFCLSPDNKEASYFAAVNERGELVDHLAIPGGTRVDGDKMREKVIHFLMVNRPAAIVVGTGGGVESRTVARKIGEIITEATERWSKRFVQREDEDDDDYIERQAAERQMYNAGRDEDDEDDDDWKCNVDLVDDNVSQLFGRSVRGKKEFPDMAVNLKIATSIARHAKDPLAELTYAWSVASDAGVFGTEMLYMNVHPLQQILPKTMLLRQYERVLCRAVAQVGVDFNAACNQSHLHGLLTFVPGLGPRKAASIKQSLVRIGGIVDSRKALLGKRLLGPVVYNNAVAFLRIRQTEDHSKDLHPLDDTRLHPDVYHRNNWAQKIAIDALEMGENLNASSSDREDMQNTALRNIMKDSRKEIQRLFDATKEEWEAAYGPTFNVPAWDPRVNVPGEAWRDKVEELDLEAFAGILEEQGNGKWYSHLQMIKWEFRLPFQDPRTPMEPLSGDKLFRLLTGESDQTICPGKEVVGKVTATTDFGARVKLEGNVPAFVPLRNLDDDHVESAEDFVTPGDVVRAIVTTVKKDHLCVDLSLRKEDLNKLPSSWERPPTLPNLDSKFDREAAQKIERDKQKEREERLAAMRLTTDKGAMDVDGKSKRQGKVMKRACAHPAFRNELEYGVVDRELREAGDAMVGEALIRPSKRDADILAVHWVVRPGIIHYIEVVEEDKETDASIGRILKIKDEEFGSIDEILGRYIAPLNDRVEEVMNHRKFIDKLMSEVDTYLKEQKEKTTGPVYNLCWNEERPGSVSLRYITGRNVRHHNIALTPEGFQWKENNKELYKNLDRLLNAFKLNPQGAPKSSSSSAAPPPPAALPPSGERNRPRRWDAPPAPPAGPPPQGWGHAPPAPPPRSRWDAPPNPAPPAGPPPAFAYGAAPLPPPRPPSGPPPSSRDYRSY